MKTFKRIAKSNKKKFLDSELKGLTDQFSNNNVGDSVKQVCSFPEYV